MAKLSAATEQALSVIAHVMMANQLAKNVKGMSGFSDFYRKQMPVKDREILTHFEKLSKCAYRDLANMIQQDEQANNGR